MLSVRQKIRKQLAVSLRRAGGELTFVQCEKRLGISGSTLHRIEMRDQNVTLDSLEPIIDRLKVTTTEMFRDPKK